VHLPLANLKSLVMLMKLLSWEMLQSLLLVVTLANGEMKVICLELTALSLMETSKILMLPIMLEISGSNTNTTVLDLFMFYLNKYTITRDNLHSESGTLRTCMPLMENLLIRPMEVLVAWICAVVAAAESWRRFAIRYLKKLSTRLPQWSLHQNLSSKSSKSLLTT